MFVGRDASLPPPPSRRRFFYPGHRAAAYRIRRSAAQEGRSSGRKEETRGNRSAAKPKPDTAKPETAAPEEAATKPAKKTPAAEEETEKPKETEKEPEKASDSGGGGASGGAKPIMVDIGVGIRGFQRHLSYKDDAYGALPDYDLNGAPEAELRSGCFPSRTQAAASPPASSVASATRLRWALRTRCLPPAPMTSPKLTTKAMQLLGGCQGQLHLWFELARCSSRVRNAVLRGRLPPPPADLNAGVPDVSYKFVKPSLSARIGVMDKLSILASARVPARFERGRDHEPRVLRFEGRERGRGSTEP